MHSPHFSTHEFENRTNSNQFSAKHTYTQSVQINYRRFNQPTGWHPLTSERTIRAQKSCGEKKNANLAIGSRSVQSMGPISVVWSGDKYEGHKISEFINFNQFCHANVKRHDWMTYYNILHVRNYLHLVRLSARCRRCNSSLYCRMLTGFGEILYLFTFAYMYIFVSKLFC